MQRSDVEKSYSTKSTLTAVGLLMLCILSFITFLWVVMALVRVVIGFAV